MSGRRRSSKIATPFANKLRSPQFECPVGEPIRKELKQEGSTQEPARQQDTRKDAVWFLISVLNVGLFLVVIPQSFLDSKWVEAVAKAAIWLGTYVFVFRSGWYRDWLLTIRARLWFKVAQLVLLMPLAVLAITLIPMFPIHPIVRPETGATLKIGSESYGPENWGTLRVPFRSQTIVLTDTHGRERPFNLSYGEIFESLRGYRPQWSLTYDVIISAVDSDFDIFIVKTDGEFDRTFPKDSPEHKLSGVDKPARESANSVRFHWQKEYEGQAKIYLPYGNYELFARKTGCDDSHRKSLSVQKSTTSRIEKLKCGG
jgi:hypothetical protein